MPTPPPYTNTHKPHPQSPSFSAPGSGQCYPKW